MIYDRYLVFSGTDMMASQVLGHEEGEVVHPEWPNWVWHGLRTEGWRIVPQPGYSDTTIHEPMAAHPPNWREVAEALADTVTDAAAREAAMDRYRVAAMEQAAYDERLDTVEVDDEPEVD